MTAANARAGSERGRLAVTLRPRHAGMIGLGGTIGAGIFVSSGQVTYVVGPAIVFCYLAAGVLGMIVMRMLGAMAAADPTPGSFAVYAGKAFGPVGRFSIGWLYWWLMVIGVAGSCFAAARIVDTWAPGVPPWIWSTLLIIIFGAVNLLSPRIFGETQFWLAGIKVVVLGLIVIGGILAICGLIPGVHPPGTINLFGRSGLSPAGGGSLFSGVLVAVFSFMGVEMVAVASGETRFRRKRSIRSALNQVLMITLVLYVAALIVLVTIVPWDSVALASGSFGALLGELNVPGAATVFSVLVFIALLSNLNSGLYTASRMVFSLATYGDAPSVFARLAGPRVPAVALIVSALISSAAFAVQYFLPSSLSSILVDTSGAVGLLVWLTIAATYLRLRLRSAGRSPDLYGPQRGFPILAVVAMVAILFLLVGMGLNATSQPQVLATVTVAVLILVVALWRDTV